MYYKIEKSPWAFTLTERLTERVPEAFESPASDWPKNKKLWPISEEGLPGDSGVFLHDIGFLIDRHSCVARSTGKVSQGQFQNKMLTKQEKLQALSRLQKTNTR